MFKCKKLWSKSGYRRGKILSRKNIAQINIQQNRLDNANIVLIDVMDVLKEVPDQEYERQIVRLYAMMEIRRLDPMKAR